MIVPLNLYLGFLMKENSTFAYCFPYESTLGWKLYYKTGVMSVNVNLYSNDDKGGVFEISKFKMLWNIELKLYFEIILMLTK